MIKKFFAYFSEFSLQKQYIYIIISVIFLPIFLIGIITTCVTYKKNIGFNSQLTQSIASNIHSNFNTFYNDIDAAYVDLILSKELSYYFEKSNLSYYDKYIVFNNLKNNILISSLLQKYRFIENITFVTNSGYSYTYTNSSEMLADYYNTNNLKLFKTYSSLNGLGTKTQLCCVDFMFPDDTTQKVLSLLRGVYSNKQLVYLIVINLKPSNISQICNAGISDKININILTSDKTIVFDTDGNHIGEKKTLDLKTDNKNLSGNFSDSKNIYFYFANPKQTFYTLIYTDKRSLNSSLSETVGIIGIASIIIGCLIFYMGTRLSNTLLKPISILTEYISGVGKGNFSLVNIPVQNREIALLVQSYNTMSEQISDMINKITLAEKEKSRQELLVKNLELEALQQQINPHFIYNTLTIINGYAIEADNDDITEITLMLSSLLRYSLGRIWEITTLGKEIAQAECYLSIQRKRQEFMPEIDINISGYENCHTTRLFLQPLLENIFLHAFPRGIDHCSRISIKAYSSEKKLFVDVSDNGIGMDENYLIDNKKGKHIGLFNVHRRIQLEYGNEYGCSIIKNSTGGTTITVCFPLS